MPTIYALQNCVTQWSYPSGKSYADPFNDVELDVEFTDPDGQTMQVPAFWAGDQSWVVRYASAKIGRHRCRTICSDTANTDLHGQEHEIEIAPYEGDNPLYKHGPLLIRPGARYLEHGDGTPFFWLGDTWWLGLCKRLGWPGDFHTLLADRVAKGYSVIQIVAGLYPDMPAFDERGANEAGFPWEKDYARINPAYFDLADLRIGRLVDAGLVPCIVGCWGYHLHWLGIEGMGRHWRNLIARWGAYPVVWCAAGEGSMPYYLTKQREKDIAFQKKQWTQLLRYIRNIDGFARPVTIHPAGPQSGYDQIEDASVIDMDMLQTGHNDHHAVPDTVRLIRRSYEKQPPKPVINAEVCYEGLGAASYANLQRHLFWSCLLSGAAGHTYGANGIWQVNRRGQPYGPSPHGMNWGDEPWDEAYQLPGSAHLGRAKRILERYEWWRFTPRPDWVEPHSNPDNYYLPYAAGIPGEVRVLYLPHRTNRTAVVKKLESGVNYHAVLSSPIEDGDHDVGAVEPDANGDWKFPMFWTPYFHDWVLILKRKD